jgi:hypothetical protein
MVSFDFYVFDLIWLNIWFFVLIELMKQIVFQTILIKDKIQF